MRVLLAGGGATGLHAALPSVTLRAGFVVSLSGYAWGRVRGEGCVKGVLNGKSIQQVSELPRPLSAGISLTGLTRQRSKGCSF
jgi:hypothetical protein